MTIQRGIAALCLCALIALGASLVTYEVLENRAMQNKTRVDWLALSESVFVPVVRLPVASDAKENEWRDALAQHADGETEKRIAHGRVDVVTRDYAIEVDFLRKWHEGLGQAIHYAAATERIGVLALIDKNTERKAAHKYLAKLRQIDSLCLTNGIKLVLLKSDG